MKILKIVLGLVLALLIIAGAVWLYLYFVAGSTSPLPETIRQWFPEEGGEPSTNLPNTPQASGDGLDSQTKNALNKISGKPIAGAIITPNNTIRYVDRATGNIFETDLDTLDTARLSNTTLPRVQEAIWSSDGNQVVFRYLSDDRSRIETFRASVPSEPPQDIAEDKELDGNFLAFNIATLTPHPENTSLFFLTENGGGSHGIVASFGKTNQEIFTSPVGWIPMWVKNDTIALLSKPSAAATGFLYALNPTTKSLERVMGNILGLTVNVRGDSKKILFSESKNNDFQLKVLDTATNEVELAPLSTLPEKCTWSKENPDMIICGVPKAITRTNYPDAWYQGVIAFDDTIWMMDLEAGTSVELETFSDLSGAPIDVIHPHLNREETHLVFQNKYDGSLWSLELPLLPESREED